MSDDFDEAFMKGATITIFAIGVLIFLFFFFVVPAEGAEEPRECALCEQWLEIHRMLMDPQSQVQVLADGTPLAEPYRIEPEFTG